MNAIWFSRHRPTASQIDDALLMGYVLVGVEPGMDLGACNIANDDDVAGVMHDLRSVVREYGAYAVFGVFPPPIQEIITSIPASRADALCFASWSVQRPAEGDAPTFEHQRWCHVGGLQHDR